MVTHTPEELRIGYVTGEYPRVTDTFIQREVAALRALGIHVQTFSVRSPQGIEAGGEELQEERQRTVYLLPCPAGRLLLSHARALWRSPGRYASGLRLALCSRGPGWKRLLWHLFYFVEAAPLAEQVNKHKLVHLRNHFGDSSATVAMLAAHLGGFSFSVAVHGPAEFFTPDHWALEEKAARALFVTCISHFCRGQMMIWAPSETWNRMHVVHCGVRTAEYGILDHRGAGSRLLYVGRLAKMKALPVLFQSVELLTDRWPNLELELVGDGPDRGSLERLAREAGLAEQVHFRGYRTPDEVRGHLERADVFVMSSLAEGVPVVLMEAMASGLPVVAPAISGIGELVQEGVTGFLTPPGDPRALADRIEKLLGSPELRTEMGRAGRAKVEREFELEREAAWLAQILGGALDGRAESLRPMDPCLDQRAAGEG